jgi:hypothetical protein
MIEWEYERDPKTQQKQALRLWASSEFVVRECNSHNTIYILSKIEPEKKRDRNKELIVPIMKSESINQIKSNQSN